MAIHLGMKMEEYEKLGVSLEGYYTLETFSERMNVDLRRAIYLLYRLRKLGFVKTSYGSGKKRRYYISLRNKQKGISYTDKINELSPIQLASSNPYYIHGRTPSYEEALIYAIKQKDIRYIIASLSLFRKINNWGLLYKIAKQEGFICKIAALYDLSRKTVRKVKRMPRRFLNLAINERGKKFVYLVDPYSSDDFKDIEKKWKVYIPLNFDDLEDYRR